MQIRWTNISAFLLAIVGGIVLLKFLPSTTASLTTINRIGPGHSMDDKVTGLIALGLIGAVLVALVRILNNRK